MQQTSRLLSPLSNQTFSKLFAAQVIALIGTGLSTVALTLLAYDLSGADAALVLGTALAFKMLAYVVFAPIIGGLAHRFSRKPFLVSMDWLRAIVVLTIPWVSHNWQIFLLIFLLNLFSAGFKPVFSALIADIFPNQKDYIKALSLTRLAYDLESLISPIIAGLGLIFFSYSALFTFNSLAFLVSSLLISITLIPLVQPVQRQKNIWHEISFGICSYLKTPRLRALLVLYLAVASASAMVIVNTVVYVRENLNGSESEVALALSAAGFGSMLGALLIAKILDSIEDRKIMLNGSFVMAIGVALIATGPSYYGVLLIWALIGFGWSLVQTSAGRVVNRSCSTSDRTAYFSAQFSISHACWLLFYLVAGGLGSELGVQTTAMILAIGIAFFTLLAVKLWPKNEQSILLHEHQAMRHHHLHTHDQHHHHDHEGWEGPEPHSHSHYHPKLQHAHSYVIDDHHATWPE